VLASEEEVPRTYQRGDYLAISPILPELRPTEIEGEPFDRRGDSSGGDLVDAPAVADLLRRNRMIPDAQSQPAR